MIRKILSGQGALAGGRADIRQVLSEFVFLAAAVAAVAFFCQNTPVMSALAGGIILARFILIGRRFDWVFLLIGIVAGGGNDMLSMAKGVYYYTPPHELAIPIPLWLLLFWGYVFVTFRQLFSLPAFRGEGFGGRPWRIDARLIADLAVVISFRLIIYHFVKHEPIPTIGYASVLALRLLAIPPKARDWKLMTVVMIVGPIYEALLIRFGLYVYFDPVFLGMPAWLLIYWAFIIPIFMKGIFDRVEEWLAAKDSAAPVFAKG
ncbi:MAG: DUF2878 family protein [bacterium]